MSKLEKTFTIKLVLRLGPCDEYDRERIQELWGSNASLTIKEISELDIPIQDRMWFLINSKVLTGKQLCSFAIDCAERVLPIWKERYPEDDRPKNAIEAARQFLAGEITAEKLFSARYEARYAACSAYSAAYAARSAYYADSAYSAYSADSAYSAASAAYAARSADYAARSADYADSAYSAASADYADSAYSAASAASAASAYSAASAAYAASAYSAASAAYAARSAARSAAEREWQLARVLHYMGSTEVDK